MTDSTGQGCARALVVGLGNPGAAYARHRHNAGFFVVDALARAHGLSFARDKDARAHVAAGRIGNARVILAKPQTYMNLSGRTAGRLLRANGIAIECMLVVYDDLDLPLGRLRLRAEGGSGGHKGMRSIQEVVGTQAFPRLRVGIDRPPAGVDPADYVLQPFLTSDRPLLDAVIDRAVSAVECWLAEGVMAAMDRFNQPFLDEGDAA
ncbi:MAG TPA: aminoacyl-tRNA hydrolase [Anaerolineae bacterium]|nr:aminoacyl-tRNA hydrolase [Anaerolineae bacterium]